MTFPLVRYQLAGLTPGHCSRTKSQLDMAQINGMSLAQFDRLRRHMDSQPRFHNAAKSY